MKRAAAAPEPADVPAPLFAAGDAVVIRGTVSLAGPGPSGMLCVALAKGVVWVLPDEVDRAAPALTPDPDLFG